MNSIKRLKSAVIACVLAVAAIFTPACNIGHSHTYSTSWSSNETQHWRDATCGHDVKANVGDHVDADGDGKCDVCGYEEEKEPPAHEHTYSDDWSTDENKHWHEATCGHDVISDEGEHVDENGDGKCDVCGYIMEETPAHEHTYSDKWSTDENKHWHAATCGHDVISDEGAHTDGNGDFVCDICGYVMHTHTYSDKWSTDENKHWHAATCGHDVVSDEGAHTDGNGDFVCDVCGYVMHVHTYSDKWTTTETEHWHASTCGHDVTSDRGEHIDVDNDGRCDVCDYVIREPEQTLVTYTCFDNETAVFEWTTTSASNAKVSYRLATASTYTEVDEQLVRQISSDTARVDIVGLKGGSVYDFKIISDGVTYIKSGVTVPAIDRSGYAHFGYSSGVGAYNDDGTAKSGARIVYVTEATKNTVTLTVGSKTYTGIVSILQNAAKDGTPLIVRIIGTVGAATWNEIAYTPAGSKLTAEEVIGANGKQLPTDSSQLTQAALIEGGYNTLDTSVYSELLGLDSKATYSGGEYDSAWNNCIVKDSSNITLEGIGEDARIFQWGLTFKNCSSIEVRNITFEDYTEDACSVEGNSGENITSAADFGSGRIWIHHNTFEEGINYWDVCPEQDKHEGDGATDFKRIANVTVSYNEYHNNHKTGLVGASNSDLTANLTYHHNFYNECMSRMPLARQANIHIYNNYYYGSTNENMSLRASAYAFIENCYFENAKNPIVSAGDDKNGYGYAKILGCIFSGKTIDSKYADKLVVVTEREQAVENTTKFGQNFDTDSTLFYYDAANKCSDVENMLTAEEVKEQVPLLAGVMKHSGSTGSDVGGSTGGDEGGNEGEITPPAGNAVEITVTANSAYVVGDTMATLKDGSTTIATVTAACAYDLKSNDHCQAKAGNGAIMNIQFASGYVYTITLTVGSSSTSAVRTLTLTLADGTMTGSPQTGGMGQDFVACSWTNVTAGSYVMKQDNNVRIKNITIAATPV